MTGSRGDPTDATQSVAKSGEAARPQIPDAEERALRYSSDFHEFTGARSIEGLVAISREALADTNFPTVEAWTRSNGKAVGCFPVYTPQEIIHSMGMLPVSIRGGGEALEISHADAALGSFLCSISKSTLELAQTGRMRDFSAFVFPYICDVSRNLEGIFSRQLPDTQTHMLHLPQNFESPATTDFLVAEYRRLIQRLAAAGGRPFDETRLSQSIEVFNEHRELVTELALLKRKEPWRLTLAEHYLIQRLGDVLPREVHIQILKNALGWIRSRECRRRDAVPTLVVGPFCEQPPLDLLELVEEVGFYVVGDEFHMQPRWHARVEPKGDPLRNLAAAYVDTPLDISVRRTPTTKEQAILSRLEATGAESVIFLSAKFCEPALEDVVLYRRGLDRKGIPSLQLEFEERSSGYEQSRLALETFTESIMFD